MTMTAGGGAGDGGHLEHDRVERERVGRCSRGTRLGVSAWRAGRSNAPAAELAAEIA